MRELDGLLKRQAMREQRADFRAGQICAQVLNAHRSKKTDRVFKPADFFPSLASLRRRVVSDAPKGELLDSFLAFAQLIGAPVVEHEQN